MDKLTRKQAERFVHLCATATPKGEPRHQRIVGLRPMDCERIADVLALDRSYEASGRYSLLVQHDGEVILADHVPGQQQTASIAIPRRHFLRLLEFYQTEQPNDQTLPTEGAAKKP